MALELHVVVNKQPLDPKVKVKLQAGLERKR
jgi:hypothetical protein